MILRGNEEGNTLPGFAAFFLDGFLEAPLLEMDFGGVDGGGTEAVPCFFELLLASTGVRVRSGVWIMWK